MKTITLKSELNPAFKMTQPLPLLPAGFVAKRAWAARPFTAVVTMAETFRLDASSNRCTMPLRQETGAQNARLVA